MVEKLAGSSDIYLLGVDDTTLDLFESQYKVPQGVSYNSYLIRDEKIAVLDTADHRATDVWFDHLEEALDGKAPDYLIVHHMEPDHSGNIRTFMEKYPDTKIVVNPKIKVMLHQFIDVNYDDREVIVNEGDTLNLGSHSLTFYTAPMVHWPEVMVSYDAKDKVLFSADAFGKFGAVGDKRYAEPESWTDEARRYYLNIVGKYGMMAQMLLKKAAGLDIKTICPLHGPVINENLGYYLDKYNTWSSYRPEEEGVFIPYASVHGNTKAAALKLAELVEKRGVKAVPFDLTRGDAAEAVADCYRYDKIIFVSVTYDGGIFPCMETLLYKLSLKNFQNRKVALMENGSWAPQAARIMGEALSKMKNITICSNKVTIRSAMKEADVQAMNAMLDELLA
ncbi:MAG: FprA family A-type flavoprotein [Lachnospiraceae bacterium]